MMRLFPADSLYQLLVWYGAGQVAHAPGPLIKIDKL